ncbi:GNAT family N-acetyltransferase [Nocardioides sp.]|uniref:GNAT family N-acetyltransferase n=1 Tax=Nocardioides sp. TaxID=35761 RepID=UPI001A1B7926|nr:GNAT family N-acetyltransferase [Nocardioides sp.]MBJ7356498.1 GNAT family N-acetyltransferase [Nocardioides sp.]
MSSVAYRRGTVRDRAALQALLSALSPESAYARFQTALGGGPPPAVVDALLPEGPRGEALLAWDDGDLVAHGLWVRWGPPRVAEIALVVTDGYQRRGIGTQLADRLVAAAAARGVERIEVVSGSGNRAVARMVARRAPAAGRDRDGLTVSYSVDLPARRWSRAA